MERETEKLVAKAHSKITRIKGQEYSPTADEIVNQINKMTGVEWLVMRYNQRQGVLRDEDIEKAKQVEKEQHNDTWTDSRIYHNGDDYIGKEKTFEQYYNETYGKK